MMNGILIKHKAALMAASLAMLSLPTSADEGMWPLFELPQAVYEQMQAEGFELPKESLYDGDQALRNCVVNFSGYCTGVVVSPDGLVFTNHHCGFDAINSHSTVENDYMTNGFSASTLADELPNEDMYVSFMVSQRDITTQLQALGIDNMSSYDKNELIDSLEQAMSDEASAADSTLHVEIDAFYEGNEWWATTYRMFTDIRLVFAPPSSIGKFGGDTDNWMWPRQTCDFSVFRIYADPLTNAPADYNPSNVPYKASKWAQVSLEGYEEGSFSMTVGYPGGTSRYLSSYGIREMRDAENAVRAQVRGIKQDIMRRHMDQSTSVRIKYESAYAHSSNYWKNAIGMNKCIDSIGIIRQKEVYETQIREWQDSTGFLKGKLDFGKLARLYAERFDYVRAFYYFWETFHNTTELVRRAQKVYTDMPLMGTKHKPYFEFKDNSDEWDTELDKEVLSALMDNYRKNVDSRFLPAFYGTIDSIFYGSCPAYIDFVYENSMLMKKGCKIYQDKKGLRRAEKDFGMQMGLALTDLKAYLHDELDALTDSIEEQERYLCAAKLRMEEDMPHYSDANFTMRLSYGQVGGYELNGSPSGYYTTAESIVKKMEMGETVPDYFALPVLKELLADPESYSIYKDKGTDKMQLCFLTNNDITGGNSGSPMFNGKGELIGLAFDGNWDSLSSDIYFDKRLARCIGVDIRYVVYMIDKWGNAGRLLQELLPAKDKH